MSVRIYLIQEYLPCLIYSFKNGGVGGGVSVTINKDSPVEPAASGPLKKSDMGLPMFVTRGRCLVADL